MDNQAILVSCTLVLHSTEFFTQVIPAHRSQFFIQDVSPGLLLASSVDRNDNKSTEEVAFYRQRHTKKEALCQFSTWHTFIRTHNFFLFFWTTHRSHVTTLSHWTPEEWRSRWRFFPHLHPCSSAVGAERHGMPLELCVPHDL